MNTTSFSGYQNWERRHNRDFGIVIFCCMAFILLLAALAYGRKSNDYEILWAQSEAQNSCLTLAVQADAQGRTGDALNYLRLANDSQYDSIPCE